MKAMRNLYNTEDGSKKQVSINLHAVSMEKYLETSHWKTKKMTELCSYGSGSYRRKEHTNASYMFVVLSSVRSVGITFHTSRTRHLLVAFTKSQKATITLIISVCLSVCPSICPSAWNNSPKIRRIFIKFRISIFFESLSRKFTFFKNLTRITRTVHEDMCTVVTISRSVLLRMRNVSDRICR
jgi:hypothetical protein